MKATLAALMMVLSASVASAADDWNALAIDDDTMTVGMAVDQPSKEAAEALAKSECLKEGAKGCGTVVSREGGCLALSRNASGSSLGYGMEDTIQETVAEALKQCADGGKYEGCTVHSNMCASN
ncbi:DUF4189 domain-containing protein [Martelella endophytica]|nr:DUF4189 domain-containing protein [Martelella endophytica]